MGSLLSNPASVSALAEMSSILGMANFQSQDAITQSTMNSAVFNPALMATSGFTQANNPQIINNTGLIIGLIVIITIISLIIIYR